MYGTISKIEEKAENPLHHPYPDVIFSYMYRYVRYYHHLELLYMQDSLHPNSS